MVCEEYELLATRLGALHLSSSALLQKACLPAAYEECILEEGEDKLETSVKQEVQEDSRASGLPLPKVKSSLNES